MADHHCYMDGADGTYLLKSMKGTRSYVICALHATQDRRTGREVMPKEGALPTWETVADALAYAAGKHRYQVDKAGRPFILHPFGVAARLSYDPLLATVGALHDVIEDCGVGPGTLRGRYGSRVADLVTILSRRHGESYDDYLARVRADRDAVTVKLADIGDNYSRLGNIEDRELRARLQQKYRAARLTLLGLATTAPRSGVPPSP